MKNVHFMAVATALALVPGCAADVIEGDEDQEIGVTQQALTWQGEIIERDDNGSSQTAYYMYTLDVDGTVCGGANDYIVHYNRSGAYANRSKLRLDAVSGTGAGCMLTFFGNQLSSRVYDNDHVWVCAGKTRTDLCGGPSAVFGGLQLWQAP